MIRLIHKADFFVLINGRCTGTMVPGAYVPRGTSCLVPRPGYDIPAQEVVLYQSEWGRFPKTLNRVEGNRHPRKCRIMLPTYSGVTVPVGSHT